MKNETKDKINQKAPDGKTLFGMVKMGEKGQIVIPKEARDMFGFKPGDMLLILGDTKQGLAIPSKEVMERFQRVLNENINPFADSDDDISKTGMEE